MTFIFSKLVKLTLLETPIKKNKENNEVFSDRHVPRPNHSLNNTKNKISKQQFFCSGKNSFQQEKKS